jgi:hypothetical protein
MTWIKTIPMSEADEKLRQAMEGQRPMYPKEYGVPVHPDESGILHRRLPHSDSRCALSRLRNLRSSDVARPAAQPPSA